MGDLRKKVEESARRSNLRHERVASEQRENGSNVIRTFSEEEYRQDKEAENQEINKHGIRHNPR